MMVEQSAEEALNSLVEEMREILAAPVYNTTPLQDVSDKFWLALGEAKKQNRSKEERLEQSLAKIKGDFLLAREEYEEQLSKERERVDSLKRRYNELRQDQREQQQQQYQQQQQQQLSQDGGGGIDVPYTPNRPQSAVSRSSGGGSGDANNPSGLHNYNFQGMEDDGGLRAKYRNKLDSQSVVSLGSEFAQKAKSLVHLLNCQGKETPYNSADAPAGADSVRQFATFGHQHDR
jgi:TolA-binding protein